MTNKAILTFDLEFWYNSKFLKNYIDPETYQIIDHKEKTIELLLDLLRKYDQKATFFVLGKLAEQFPELIKKIFDSGHEIASHGYSHKTIDKLSESEFEQELISSKEVTKKIIFKDPIGFRAPNFSLNEKTQWALKILKNYGFKYDASSFLKKEKSDIILRVTTRLGGIYFRILPLWVFVLIINLLKQPIVLYFHPNELFAFTPQLKSAPWLKRKIKYWGTKNAFKKFEKLLQKFKFMSVEQYLNENTAN
jgi:peptidoglycan-N-acetylglucosamine deacetylase